MPGGNRPVSGASYPLSPRRARRSTDGSMLRDNDIRLRSSAAVRLPSPPAMKKPPPSLLIGYLLFGGFIVLESALRQGEEARVARGGSQDQGTSRLLGAVYGAGLIVMPLLSIVRGRRGVPAALGPIVMLIAIGLRAWAAITLGRFYTRTLRTLSDQQVVRSGPYRFVRHPGYLGSLLMWLGFGLSTCDWLAGAAALSAMSGLYLRHQGRRGHAAAGAW
jgi:isoprenylcysteine carboxyl methyltransferase (ICMT) family protein YpbQ